MLLTNFDYLIRAAKVCSKQDKKMSPRIRTPNPVCSDPTHRKTGTTVQRHICRLCMQRDVDRLKTNPHLTPWDLSCTMNLLSRSYFCGLCVMEGNTDFLQIRPGKICRLHSVYNKQHVCSAHKRAWASCSKCTHEFRAATRICYLCCKSYRHCCACQRGPAALCGAAMELAAPQDAKQVDLKARLAANALAYAKGLQEAPADAVPGLVEQRAVPEDLSELRSIFQLRL